MNGLNQGSHAFRRRELRNAVTEVENMTGIARTETVENLFGLGRNDLRLGEQHIGVEIALQGDTVTDQRAGARQRTELDFALETASMGGLIRRLGHPDVVRGGFVAGAQGFGHLALRARDMATSTRFFCDVLGARLSDRIITRIGDMDVHITFLHWNERHHSLALGEGLPKHIHHFMLQLRDVRDVGLALDRMVDHGVRVVQTLGQHPNDKMVSFYSETPSGFEVELGWGGRTITEGWLPETHGVWTEWGHRPPAQLARASGRR